ncbi:glycosyltransferase family 2 protein [Herpetosiphon llansteffanensis]
MTMLDAAIIVVTYNHARYIGDCLNSLLALDPAPSELVVVDNASRDETAKIVKSQFPQVRFVQTGANLGFAGGCNQGARLTSAEYIVLANPDLIVQPDWLEQLIAPLERWPNIGAVGGKLLYRDGITLQHAGGVLRLPWGLGHHRGVGEHDHGQYNALETVDYVTGAAFACRRSTWESLDGLDEQFYPAYYEEVDFCTRLRRAGLDILYTPRAVATHIEGSSVGHRSAVYLQLYHFNRLRYLFKYFNNTWLMRTWLPAEMGHIRACASDDEIQALKIAYLAYQSAFLNHESQPVISELDIFPDETADGGETELQWIERQLRAKVNVAPAPIPARRPWLGAIRNGLLRLATRDFVVPIVQAQNDANAALLESIQALSRQRRAADATILLQGMLLAKSLDQQPKA